MARLKSIALVLLGLSACAPSPTYVARSRVGTVGEIPRNDRGEPIWSAIRQPAPSDPSPVMPPADGIPVTPPRR